MIIFRILRVLITVIIIIFLLAVGTFSLFAYSVDNVVFTSSYFGQELLYSGTYSYLYSYVIDTYVPVKDTDDMQTKAADPVYANIMHAIKPTVFSNIAAGYLSDWMEYLLGEVPDSNIPVLNIQEHRESIYASAMALTESDEFMYALLNQVLTSQGQSSANYTQEELDSLIKTMNIRTYYGDLVNGALDNPSSLYYQTVENNDPLAVLKYAAPTLSDDELTAKIKSFNGIAIYYKSIANLIFAGILACLGIILIMWIKKLSLAFLLDGSVIVFAGIPLFVMSISGKAFNAFIRYFSKYLPSYVPDIKNVDFFNNLAITPIVDYMLIVSGITIAIGLMFLLFSILLRKERKPKTLRPQINV